jgi:hypothetical protein
MPTSPEESVEGKDGGRYKTVTLSIETGQSAWLVSATEFQLRRGNNSEVDSDKPIYRY